ncbi:unnamed protein product [Fraxinus pennsylvanica]|uniref:Uncharacterized protein n=1 Tax=Fraxinus pennsylvanica TaxID=56036 RepID=A0AAD2A9G4_9LAMI|nr:unnamed protein product [Fraxinus pennsylvanica]
MDRWRRFRSGVNNIETVFIALRDNEDSYSEPPPRRPRFLWNLPCDVDRGKFTQLFYQSGFEEIAAVIYNFYFSHVPLSLFTLFSMTITASFSELGLWLKMSSGDTLHEIVCIFITLIIVSKFHKCVYLLVLMRLWNIKKLLSAGNGYYEEFCDFPVISFY